MQRTLNENNVHTVEKVYRMQIKCSQIFLKAFIHALQKKERKTVVVHIQVAIWEVKVDSDFTEIECNLTHPFSMTVGLDCIQAGGVQG